MLMPSTITAAPPYPIHVLPRECTHCCLPCHYPGNWMVFAHSPTPDTSVPESSDQSIAIADMIQPQEFLNRS